MFKPTNSIEDLPEHVIEYYDLTTSEHKGLGGKEWLRQYRLGVNKANMAYNFDVSYNTMKKHWRIYFKKTGEKSGVEMRRADK